MNAKAPAQAAAHATALPVAASGSVGTPVRKAASDPASWSPRAQFRRWWQARLPQADSWQLGQRNIYILPTRAGFTFFGTLVVMLLAAINYQLNLGYALTFLLAGVGVVAIHLTHGNLRGLTLHLRPIQAGFAGDPARLEVVVHNPGRERHALALRFEDAAARAGTPAWCDAPRQGQSSVTLSFVPPCRGWHAVPVLVLETVFPFGLFRAWTVWRPAGRVLAWPRPESPAPPLPVSAHAPGEERPSRRGAGSELDGVRPWRRGDSMRQVAWKKVARSGELVSRETAGTATRELWLDWAETPAGDAEVRLSRLAAWVLLADQQGLDLALRLPSGRLPPGQGDAHRRAALGMLAEHP